MAPPITTFKGFQPKTVIDAGAYVGKWTIEARKLWPHAHHIMVEASPSKIPELESRCNEWRSHHNCTVVNTMLGEKKGVETYYDGSTGASRYKEDTKFFRGVQSSTLPINTVDGMVRDLSVEEGSVEVLKLDIQGSELQALKGSVKTLQSVKLVLFETSIVDYNPGGACYFEIDEFLRAHGFVLFKILTQQESLIEFNMPGVKQVDLAYIKNDAFPGSKYCLSRQKISTEGNDTNSIIGALIVGIFIGLLLPKLVKKPMVLSSKKRTV